MPRTYFTQTAFTAGELTPHMLGRTDVTRYFSGVQTMENFVVLRQGGAQNRSGTRFVGEVKDSSAFTRLVPFEFSVEQTYAIEFGNLYIRFFRYDLNGNPGVLQATASILRFDSTTTVDVTGDFSLSYLPGDSITISGADLSANNITFIVLTTVFAAGETKITATAPVFTVDDPSAGTMIGGRVEIVSPYTTAQLREIKYTQSADSMIFCHPDVEPKVLNRRGADSDPASWTINKFNNTDGPYVLGVEGPFDMQLSVAGAFDGRLTITDGQAPFLDQDDRFLNNPLRIDKDGDGARWGWLTVRAISGDGTFIDFDAGFGLGNLTSRFRTANFRFPAWNTEDGYPFCTTFHGGRLYFGGTDLAPQTIWGSRIGVFTSFSPTDKKANQLPDFGIEYTIDDAQVNAIRWLESDANGMIIPTSGAIHLMRGGAIGDPITPTNVLVQAQIHRGSSELVRPHRLGDVLVTIMSGDKSVREIAFNDDVQRLAGPELTILSTQIAGTGFTDSDYAEEPQRILWLSRTDGELVGLTIERDQEVVAWHRQVIGGTFEGGKAVVEPIIVIKNLVLQFDQPWVIVKRTIDGGTKRYVETLLPEMTLEQDPATAVFADSAILFSGAATTVITGLDHLEGETVSVRGEGATLTSQVVENGQITVSPAVTQASIGLPYQPTLKTMPLVVAGGQIDSRAKLFRPSRVALLLNRTIGGKVIGETEQEELIMREAGEPMDSPPSVFTGYKNVNPDSSHEQQSTITVIQDEPQPITILALTLEAVVDGLST